MNFLKNLAKTVYSTVNKVGSTIKGAFNQGNSNLAGLAASTNKSIYASPAQQAAQNTSVKTGPGITSTPIPASLKAGVGIPKSTAPSGSIMSAASAAGLQAARSIAANSKGGYTPVNSYGGLTPTPTTLNAGQRTMSAPQNFLSSAGETQSFQSFMPSSNNSAFSSVNSASIASAPVSSSLPSAPGYSNPGAINTAGTVSDLNGTKQIDPNTGLLIDVPQDPAQAEADQRRKQIDELLGSLPRKEDVANDADVKRQQAEVQARKQELNNYTSQLNSVVAKQNQDLLTLRGIGGAEGVTEAVYGGQAAQINREAAIKALPIQAQISAAQGNLELAQDYLTDLKKVKQDAIDADYGYNMKKFEAISGFVTGEQKIRLDQLKQTETRAYQTTQNNLEDRTYWMRKAAEVKPSLINKIGAINPASPTYSKDMAQVLSQLPAPVKKTTGSNTSSGSMNSPYTNDLDAIVGATASSIPTKFGQETFQKEMARARNDSDKINLVATQVLKGQPSELKLDFAKQASGIANIDKAINLLDGGIKTGILQNAAQYAYNLAGKDFDPKLAQINSYLTSAIQPYRNSVTGAAWGDQEDGEYETLFGSTKFSPPELKQRLVQMKEILKSKSANGLNAFVNPLGLYGNEFEQGTLSPSTQTSKSTIDYTATLDSIFKI